MTWLSFLSLLLSITSTVANYVREKQLLDAGKAIALTESLAASSDLLAKAIAARNSVDPSGVSTDPDNLDRRA